MTGKKAKEAKIVEADEEVIAGVKALILVFQGRLSNLSQKTM